jgi:hypothetical protein
MQFELGQQQVFNSKILPLTFTVLPFKQRLSTSIFYDSNYEMQRSLTVLNGWESCNMSTDFKTINSNTCSGRINSNFAYARPWKTDSLLTVYAALKIWSTCEQRWRLGDEGLQEHGYVSNVKISWLITATQNPILCAPRAWVSNNQTYPQHYLLYVSSKHEQMWLTTSLIKCVYAGVKGR